MKKKIGLFIGALMFSILLPFLSLCNSTQKVEASYDLNFEIEQTEDYISKVSGDFVGRVISDVDDVYLLLDQFKVTFGFSSSRDVLKFNKKQESVTGYTYFFDQYFNDVEVYGGALNVSVNYDGRVEYIIGKYYTDLNVDTQENYSQQQTQNLIQERFNQSDVDLVQKVIYPDVNSAYYSYIYNVEGIDAKVFVSARTQKVFRRVATSSALTSLPTSGYTIEQETIQDTAYDGDNVSITIDKYINDTNSSDYFYVLADASKNIYVADANNLDTFENYTYITSTTPDFSDSVAVQAFEGLIKCYDFYADSSNFGTAIKGITNQNGDTINLIGLVHYSVKYNNAAFWIASTHSKTGYFVFGDGDGLKNFVSGLDIIGHEYQHAITDSICALEYADGSGALSEAVSDIFGAAIEGNSISDSDFWRMGEDLYTYSSINCIRNMSNPSSLGDVAHYDSLKYCTSASCAAGGHEDCDYGYVHENSTLMTYATYLMWKNDPTFFTEYRILQLWYKTLFGLTKTAGFEDFASAMVSSATALGYSDTEVRKIEYAFATVGIPGYTGVEIWNNNTLEFLEGSGTVVDPYQIKDVADLASLAYYVNNNIDDGAYATARYKLTANIDLGGVAWEAIGTEAYPFNGQFNGNTYTISGLNLNNTESDYMGLFGYTSTSAYIYDLNIGVGQTITTANYSGAIVGLLKGTISGCSSALNISGVNVGGLAGFIENAQGSQFIVNSYSTASLTGEVVGGIVADFSSIKNSVANVHISGHISSCYATGTLTGAIVGGIVARANGLILSNCISAVNIVANAEGTVGGIVGIFQYQNLSNKTETNSDTLTDYILSCKSVSSIDSAYEKGTILGGHVGVSQYYNIYIENTIVRELSDVELCSDSLNLSNIIVDEKTRTSQDAIFTGDFDFDNEFYYKIQDNWTILEGNEAFNLTTAFDVKDYQELPTFGDVDFWLSNAASSFDGGVGTKSNPYLINNAKQLARLASLLFDSNTYEYYCDKYYKLTSDIDLDGYIWTGLGYSLITIQSGTTTNVEDYPFMGHIDGNGHTISNLNSVAAYSIAGSDATGTNYILLELNASFLGLTSANSSAVNPSVQDLTLQDVIITGSYSASIASVVNNGIDLSNVSVIGGNISSSGLAGGLIASLGTGTSNSTSAVINIIDCFTNVNVSGTIAGGAVGYALDNGYGSTLNIINYLNKGDIFVTGINYDSTVSSNSPSYYKPMAGGVIGIAMAKNINIINSVVMGDIVAYNEGAQMAYFIGCTGIGATTAPSQINITIDGCKQLGEAYFIFESVIPTAGAIIGATHSQFTAPINLAITSNTYLTTGADLIAENNSLNINIQDYSVQSTDQAYTGTYDFYTPSYFTCSTYFNSEYYWDNEAQGRFYNVVTFKNPDGTILSQVTIKDNEQIDFPQNPTMESSAKYDFEFEGWLSSLTDITRSQTVYAQYSNQERVYTVTYKDSNGNVIKELTLKYGELVNQEIEAPEKQSNFFFEYEFVRWGEEGQIVESDMTVYAVYKTTLTGTVTFIIFILVILAFGGIIVVASRKKIK